MSLKRHLSDALRLAVWRAPRAPNPALSPSSIALIFLSGALAIVAQQFFEAGATITAFSLYGVNSILADLAVSAGLIALFARVDQTPATLRNLVLLHVCGLLFFIGATKLQSPLMSAIMTNTMSPGMSPAAFMAIFIGLLEIFRRSGSRFA